MIEVDIGSKGSLTASEDIRRRERTEQNAGTGWLTWRRRTNKPRQHPQYPTKLLREGTAADRGANDHNERSRFASSAPLWRLWRWGSLCCGEAFRPAPLAVLVNN